MLPTFVGIGVPRGGTTWLHELLAAHPDVAVPARGKEVHYFDLHYERGVEWYESVFPRGADTSRCRAAVEITPHYFYDDRCPARIAELPSVRGLILMLRNPVDRAFSHYVWRIRTADYRGPFAQFLEDVPEAIHWGRYAANLKKYLACFPLSRMLILIHEHAFADVPAARRRIADFLGVDDAGFPEGAGMDKVNPGTIPRFRRLSRIVSRAAFRLRRRDIHWVSSIGTKLGVKRLLSVEATGPAPALPDEARRRLRDMFVRDVEELEALAGLDLTVWKEMPTVEPDPRRAR
jgi:hypothetical protein